MSTRDDLLHAYLRDHLTGATGGLSLARRLPDNHRDRPAAGELAQFARDVEADPAAPLEVMDAVGAHQNTIKPMLAAVGERISRFKVNGTLFRRSPLSGVMELEIMRMGVEGKSSGWRNLREIAQTDPRLDHSPLNGLVTRAEGQATLLEQLAAVAGALID